MGASITLAGESLIAQKHVAQQGLDVARFIFAHVPGLDPNGPVDRAAPKPAAAQIVHVYDIPNDNAGYVNPNQVVYSSQIGSDVGDWDFNWIGLETAEGVLFAVAYVPLQIKRRNIPPLQIGNNLTRNFLVAFDGAQALTGITIDASTWQHDFTVRLAGIDERERLSNRDIFGRACFFGSALQLEKVGGVYQLKPGTAYIEGIRVTRSAALPVVPSGIATTAWLDVALQRELSDVAASWQVVFAADRPDYTDSAGVRHYCVAIADLPNSNTVVDRRPVEAIGGPLVTHFAARVGDYENLRARATTKDDVDLGNLPNAKSDSVELDDSESLATSKAVAKLWKSICVQMTDVAGDVTLTAAARGLVMVDAGTGNRTITLPASNAALGVIDFIVRRTDNGGNRVVVQAAGTDKIQFHTHLKASGYPFFVLMGAGDWWHLRSTGAGGWIPIGRLDPTAVGRPVMETTTAIPPGGYAAIRGTILNRAEWPWLWDHAQQSGMLTTEAARAGTEGGWTLGDGATTFRMPDGRAHFYRVLDDGLLVDAGRVAGSKQADEFARHSHELTSGYNNLQTSFNPNSNDVGRAGNPAGSEYPTLPTGGNETRPINIAYPGRLKLI
ncbi:phage tail protein [Pseudomonas sp. TNT2022 ID233]|uniref:phage tail-collar fiber domain-containing protein n=1 Tax=Pseudomonas aphyarum TaxID=2942629 RepID=UPI00235F481C|nr:phage tail protein [Pseudomonas aphyarum]MDD1138562.1 phage tail protein [Pseudomonas aphyarum]